ncbi:MAG: aminotransferase class I and II, partial [Saprospiraceae bacterium]|nr:aminotransferase class I and II [Saprospiraceae bacterium]
LREGGSLPAIVEADDGFLYVLKFRGAGQGIKALIAELIGGEVARAVGLKLPEIVFAELDEAFGRTEADEEIQDLLKFSTGLNLGLHYLSGAVTYDPAVAKVEALLASRIVWLDAFLMNVDRTARNTNMLLWHEELWLIDHGAALYFHHNWENWQVQSTRPFVQIKDHVLLPQASAMEEADKLIKTLLTKEVIGHIVALIPDNWITATFDESAEVVRNIYSEFLGVRLEHREIFVNQVLHARATII